MRDASSNNLTKKPAFELSTRGRVAMVLLGYIPLVHVLMSVGCVLLVASRFGLTAAVLAGVASIYLLPPLGVGLLRPNAWLTGQRYCAASSGFLRWWYTTQWQVLFNRFPVLEEAIRLVPGLYSTWLRLWGAKVGGLVYWSPGVRVFDRPFLRIGDHVVIGADTKICPHIIVRGESGTELILAPISIGAGALVGGSTLLPAGVSIADCEQTPGGRPMAPFADFRDGRHRRTTRFDREVHCE